MFRVWLVLIAMNAFTLYGQTQPDLIDLGSYPYNIYPAVNKLRPDFPSPFSSKNGGTYVIGVTIEDQYAIIPVTINNSYEICPELIVDTFDFPSLAKTGLHKDHELNNLRSITGRSITEITDLARPGGLSQAGFLAADEDILAVLKADNQIVKKMGLTHPQMAKTLFHVLNMMDQDLALNRWNMAKHQWENIQSFYYNQQMVYVEAYDTKGGQKSIFNDGIEGAFHIKLWREINNEEIQYLQKAYHFLSPDEMDTFLSRLSMINIGEMQPQYIMRYGFYEGHTFWRADPIAISFIFGLKSILELEEIFEHNLYTLLTKHF